MSGAERGRRGRLSVVATPIGNLADLSPRALSTLREADVILAEDTRRTRALCTHHGVSTRLVAFHAHTSDARREAILGELAGGARMALVTDAGTPVVSDPGIDLVDACLARGIAVEGIAGPSAVTAALAVCGLRCDTFRFVGFLPRAGRKRSTTIAAIAADESATVLFEAPGRVGATLGALGEALGDRRVAVCRELTKVHEEVLRGSAADVVARLPEPMRGEVTIVVEASAHPAGEAGALSDAEVDGLIDEALASGVRAREVARTVARHTGLSGSEAYRRVVGRAARGGGRAGEP